MEQQQLASNQLREWHPTTIFSNRYHSYAVVVMSRPLKWESQKMFAIWEKAKLTVTVNGGTCKWIKYLEDAGINIFDGQHNKFVPNVIIVKNVLRLPGAPPTMVQRLENLGSMVIHLPGQNRMNFMEILSSIADHAYGTNMNLKDMYLFSESETNFDAIQNTETLRLCDGNIRNIEIVIVACSYFYWMLCRGLHKIHVAPDTSDEKMLTTRTCSFLTFDFCTVNNLTTTGLQTNFTNTSARELDEKMILIPCSENVVTVNTDASIIWVMSLDTTKEDIYYETSDDEFVDR